MVGYAPANGGTVGIVLRLALTVMLAVGVAAVDVTPAHAALRLFVRVSQSDIVEGDPVTFKGRSSKPQPGAVVTLRRRVDDGWIRVNRIRLGEVSHFSFTTVPPRGHQHYQIRMLRQGRLLTGTAKVVHVHWRPDLRDMAVTNEADHASDDVHVDVRGRVGAVADGTALTREVFHGTNWQSVATRTITDHRWSDTFTVPYGTTYRYTLPASGLRLAAVSPVMQAEARGSIPVDATTGVAFPTEHRHLRLALEAGQTYTYYGPYWVRSQLTDPTGQAIPGFGGSSDYITFEAPRNGTYALDLEGNPAEEQPAQITISRPLEMSTALDSGQLDLATSLPGQLMDLTFEGTPQGYISQHDGGISSLVRDKMQLIAPGGETVPLLTTLEDRTRVWQLPDVAGPYTMRVTPAFPTVDTPDFEMLSVIERTMPLDAAATTVDFDRPRRVAVLSTATPPGADISFSSSPWLTHQLFAPDGTQVSGLPAVSPTQAGRYRMLVSAPEAGRADFFASTAMWFDAGIDGPSVPFDLGPAVARDSLLRIPAEAGDIFSVAAHHEDDRRCESIGSVHPTSSAVTVRQSPSAHPMVVIAEETGTVVVRLNTCQQQGWWSVRRITPVTMEPMPTNAHQARATFAQPGDVAMLMLDVAPEFDNQRFDDLTFSIAGRDLTGDDNVTFAGDGFLGSFNRRIQVRTGLHPLIVWGGPRATGWVDIRATR
jgi:hypothetical protein